MEQFKVELVYCGLKTTLDLRRVVAISHPQSGKFLIYFENAVWSVDEKEYDSVYKANGDMTCSECKFWRRKPDANGYCTCLWHTKPCEQTRRYKAKQKRNKKKLEMYGKGAKKMRF